MAEDLSLAQEEYRDWMIQSETRDEKIAREAEEIWGALWYILPHEEAVKELKALGL